ncbi:unnamed protein product [Linum tenue]|uniref:Protein kinase domain-containing protein n=1 Tax=Linum tenue TaxID=586396 RepID=A0AAV0IJQ5_9ROSI|nr:unnamed protein product [Linum tenue]
MGRLVCTCDHLFPSSANVASEIPVPGNHVRLPHLCHTDVVRFIISPLFILLLLLQACNATDGRVDCVPSSCGNIPIIKSPFQLKTDPESCGDHNYTLSCESNTTVLYLGSARCYVQAINYKNLTIRVVDDGVVKGNCSSLPSHPLSEISITSHPYSATQYVKFLLFMVGEESLNEALVLVSCENPVNSQLYLQTAPCINIGSKSSLSYALDGSQMVASDLAETCKVEMVAMLPKTKKKKKEVTFHEIHQQLEYGFELSWQQYSCPHCPRPSHCYLLKFGFYRCNNVVLVLAFTRAIGIPLVIAFLIYKWRMRHQSAYANIEEFLQKQTLMPIRYSYSDIKKVTEGFKDKLGEGGFGSVYKAKLRGGSFAAVKVLGTKKSSTTGGGNGGQDFMSEVATIGRIHHVNVVRLIGYCSEGSKRALVYEFMPNGSLDKHILHHNQGSLSLEQLYHISLGVARGIEYLHSGCATQILHFDIKPHNILLDQTFNPKISDFGLAKLNHPGGDHSIAALTAARGTIGYMAPEMFYKNIGTVSYKADVYSFGMLVLEMTGKWKNLNAATEHSSVYFPSWVHNEVSMPGTPIAVGEVTQEEDNIAKKMVIVGLWCIQTNPANRPPMNKVVEMLEGDLESLELPPKPVLYAAETVTKNEEGSSSSSHMSSEFTQSIISTVNNYESPQW